jgi:hypothetical protein
MSKSWSLPITEKATVAASYHVDFFSLLTIAGGHSAALGGLKRGRANRDPFCMIRKLKSGEFRLYSRKKDPKSGRRRNLGTFSTREAAEKHEREVQYFKRH